MTRSEILEGPERRRRWSDDEKASILAELSKPGSNGAEVARLYGVARSLIYAWRKELKAPLRTAGGTAGPMPFAPVLLAGPAPMAETQAALPTDPTNVGRGTHDRDVSQIPEGKWLLRLRGACSRICA
jgi:transposase